MDEVLKTIAECAERQKQHPGFATYISFSEVQAAFDSLTETNQALARENAQLRGLPMALTGEEVRNAA
jgi:hypothetical protein